MAPVFRPTVFRSLVFVKVRAVGRVTESLTAMEALPIMGVLSPLSLKQSPVPASVTLDLTARDRVPLAQL